MSQAALKAAATAPGTSVAKRTEVPKTFPAFLEAYKSEISRALPKHLNAERMARIALTEFRKSPNLGNCTPKSVFASVLMGAQLGLEPGIMGQAYLIPYGKECQFVPGWQGLADIVSRSGRASVWTGAVFTGDEFDYALGDQPYVRHRPMGEDDPTKLTHVYAIGRINGSSWPVIEVWTALKILKHRDRFNRVGKRHYSYEHFEMYGRKVALLQVLKYMPKSVELATAVSLEHAAETGGQRLDPTGVIDGSWSAVEEPDSNEPIDDHDPPQFDDASALKAIKDATEIEALEKAWAAIALDYTQSKREIHPDIDQAYKAQKEKFVAASSRK
jgi:recombination protein RecT